MKFRAYNSTSTSAVLQRRPPPITELARSQRFVHRQCFTGQCLPFCSGRTTTTARPPAPTSTGRPTRFDVRADRHRGPSPASYSRLRPDREHGLLRTKSRPLNNGSAGPRFLSNIANTRYFQQPEHAHRVDRRHRFEHPDQPQLDRQSADRRRRHYDIDRLTDGSELHPDHIRRCHHHDLQQHRVGQKAPSTIMR